MKMALNEVEADLIEFLSGITDRPYSDVEASFADIRRRFRFAGFGYRDLCCAIHRLFGILYDDRDEAAAIRSYQFHALMHLFRFVSYSYGRSAFGCFDYLKYATKAVLRGELRDLYSSVWKRLLAGLSGHKQSKNDAAIAKLLVSEARESPLVVDYGCGLGYISFEIGRLDSSARIYLLDIDCLTLRFAEFRFRKRGINVEVIPVMVSEPYPRLPEHNICIATEVMEHLAQPLTAYRNICESLKPGGILYGEFSDHRREMFHASPDLSELRLRIARDFRPAGVIGYKKTG